VSAAAVRGSLLSWFSSNSPRARVVAFGCAAAVLAGGLQIAEAAVAPAPAHAAVKPAPAPPDQEPDVASAQLAARRGGHQVEVTGARSQDTTTFVEPDGTFQTDFYAAPIRVRRGADLVAVDTALVSDSAGLHPRATPVATQLATGGSGSPVASLTAGDSSFGLGWLGNLPAPTVTGATATYADVAPGVDLHVTATTTGFELSAVLKNRPSTPATVRLPLHLKGLAVQRDAGSGALTLTDARSGRAFTVSPPVMFDAARDRSGEPTHLGQVATALTPTGNGGYELDLTPDAAYLADPATTFPVTIDPSVLGAGGQGTMVRSSYPTTNFQSWGQTFVGKVLSTESDRSYAQWTNLSSLLAGKHILWATTSIYNTFSYTCTAQPVNVYQVTSSWSGSSMTWNTQPTVNTSSVKATGSAAYGTNSAGGTCSAASWLSLGGSGNLAQLVDGWVKGSTANYGIEYAADESSTCCGKKAAGFNDLNNPEKLTVSYNSYPGTPAGRSITPCASVCAGTVITNSATPTLTANTTDPDGGTLRYDFEVYPGTSPTPGTTPLTASGSVANAPSGQRVGWKVTTPLGDGQTYSYRVRAYDGTDYGPWSTGWASFTVDTVAPAAPTASSATYVQGGWKALAQGSFTLAGSDTGSGVDHYVYGLDVAVPNTAMGSGAIVTPTLYPGDGWHQFLVQAVDKAGNKSAITTFAFGTTPGLTSPTAGASTQQSVLLGSIAPPANTAVTYYYRRAATDPWTPLPPPDVTVTSSGAAVGGWPYTFSAGSGNTSPPSLTWNTAATLAGTDGPAQLAVCFAAGCPTGPASSLPTGSSSTTGVPLTLDTKAFNIAATDDLTPGSINLLTGAYQVQASDVSVPGSSDTTLTVGRSLTSTNTGVDGIFGPGWTASLPVDSAGADWTGLTDTGSVLTATHADQSTTSFTAQPDGSYAPTGDDADSGLKITTTTGTGCAAGYRCYELDDLDGNRVIFQATVAPTPTGSLTAPVAYQVVQVIEPGTPTATSFTYTAGRPTRITAPVPAGATCTDPTAAATWMPGCRGLSLAYDTHGHLTAVTYLTSDGSNPLQVDVACYDYNATGRLAGTWDPRNIPTAGTGSHPISCASPLRPTHYDYDNSGRITGITPSAGTNSLAGWTIGYDPVTGRVSNVSRAHLDGSGTETQTVLYRVPVAPDATHPEYRPDLTAATAAGWAQQDTPDPTVGATAICPPGASVPADSSGDLRDCTLTYLDANGRGVNTASYAGSGAAGWHITTSEYDSGGHQVRSLTAADREEALAPTSGAGGALGLPANTAQAALELSTINLYTANPTDKQPDLTETFGPYHRIQLPDGSIVQAREHTVNSYDIGSEPGHPLDAAGNQVSYHLLTDTKTGASVSPDPASNGDSDVRETKTLYYLTTGASTDSTGWTYRAPMQVITDPNGLAITTTTLYDPATGRVTQTRMPNDSSGTTAGTTNNVYWTAGANSSDSTCGNKPAWDGLLCTTSPASTAPTDGLPALAATRDASYDYLNRPTQISESVAASSSVSILRTTSTLYGFNSPTSGTANPYATTVQQTQTGGGTGTTVPAQTTSYDPNTGLPTAVSNGTSSDATGYDDFGRIVSYNENTAATGAAANAVSTHYDPTHGWITSSSDAHTTNSYTYNGSGEHRGLPTGLTVTVTSTPGYTGNFTANYDPDGQLVSQTDPNNVTTALTRNEDGQLVDLNDTNGTGSWLDDRGTPSIHSQWLSHTGPAGSQTYTYDAAGRLTKTADTPTGGTCTTRTYSYDADSNRLSSTSYGPAGDGSCPTALSGGSTTSHSYDTADRLLPANADTGITYDTFGRITTLPAADVSGGAALTADYYANDLVHSQTQAGTTRTWNLDANNRLASWTNSTTGITNTNHYDDASSDSPAWTAESSDSTSWDANISDLLGSLAVTVDQTGTTTYQYANLHGDITATAAAGAATPTIQPDYDEFGNNPTGTSSRYGWLGGKRRSGDDAGGLILMGVRLYAPILGRFLQTDPVAGGSANAYDYARQDPINGLDLDGRRWHPVRWLRHHAAPLTRALGRYIAEGPYFGLDSPVFGRKGILNRNRYLRIGWGWKGTRKHGRNVFRISIGHGRGHPHIDLWDPFRY